MSTLQNFKSCGGEPVISEICDLNWSDLTECDVVSTAWAYFFFSIQFRENLQIACAIFPDDHNLAKLKLEECQTDNLSPYPDIASAGERMDHDEFMRRALTLSPIPDALARRFQAGGNEYLEEIRAISPKARALSIANYESGGLERLFKAMLQTPSYANALVAAFRFFMLEHIRFDSDPVQGHGALSRHLTGDEEILPLWEAFQRMLLAFTPGLQPRDAVGAARATSAAVAAL